DLVEPPQVFRLRRPSRMHAVAPPPQLAERVSLALARRARRQVPEQQVLLPPLDPARLGGCDAPVRPSLLDQSGELLGGRNPLRRDSLVHSRNGDPLTVGMLRVAGRL